MTSDPSSADATPQYARTPTGVSGLYRRAGRFLTRRGGVVSGLQLLPGLFWIVFFLGVSLAIIFVYSFLQQAPPQGALSLTTSNYREFFSTDLYISVLFSSLVIAIKTTSVTLLLAYPPAYYLAFTDSEWQNVFLLLLILPFWINIVIRTYAWRMILGPQGVINYVLVDLAGVLSAPAKLLYTENAVVVGLVHILLPFMLVPLYTSLDNIDHSHIEAAKNLGANEVEAFYEVTLPQSLPGISAGVVLVFVMAFGSFLTPILLGGSQNSMIANLIASMFRQINDWGLGSAMAVVFIVVVLGFVYGFNHLIGLEELYGGEE
jgi:ABC-type spermidine/putrescine transport system permease subunit I